VKLYVIGFLLLCSGCEPYPEKESRFVCIDSYSDKVTKSEWASVATLHDGMAITLYPHSEYVIPYGTLCSIEIRVKRRNVERL
jgi:hypothetical protein